jgi:prepilin-type N-terminal cleavage/methylation domain-containing protein
MKRLTDMTNRMRRLTRRAAFTILEIMLAIMIFSLVLTAIYAIWIGIIKGSILAQETAANVQRSRVSLRALEDAFTTSLMFASDYRNYAFIADTSGQMAKVSLVSRLPGSFPGVGRYGAIVRRVHFFVEPSPGGGQALVMEQAPFLQDWEQTPPYRLTLARNVTEFELKFYDLQLAEWLDEWTSTNQIPKMVKITLGLATGKDGRGLPDVVTRLVSVPTVAVAGDIQGDGPPVPVPGAPAPAP